VNIIINGINIALSAGDYFLEDSENIFGKINGDVSAKNGKK